MNKIIKQFLILLLKIADSLIELGCELEDNNYHA